MYNWNIDITLKGSGVVKRCKYSGPENTSSDVIINQFNKKQHNELIAFRSDDDKRQVFISIGEIAAIDIYEGVSVHNASRKSGRYPWGGR